MLNNLKSHPLLSSTRNTENIEILNLILIVKYVINKLMLQAIGNQ